MAFYTALDEQQLAALLARFNIDSLDRCEGASDGIENTTYMLAAGEQRWILTLFEELSAAELPFFIDLMQWLFAQGLPVAHPLVDCENRALHQLSGKPALLFPRLPGHHLREVGTVECASIGQCLGRFHRHSCQYPVPHPNPRGTAWMEQGRVRLDGLIDEATRMLLDEQIANANRLRGPGLPTGIVHGDLFRDNALFTTLDNGQHQLSGVIDFYSACHDILLLDLAITANDWCGLPDGSLDIAKVTALVTAYKAERPITPEEAAHWQLTLQLAACRFWLSRLLDEKLPRHAGIQHAHKPSAEYLARLHYHRRVATPL